MEIQIIRDQYNENTTLGKLYIDNKYFCETLEDTCRPDGIKVNKHTAIPAGFRYKVDVTMSGRFGRLMPILYTESDGITLKAGGIKFLGIRLHGGNKHTNTEGCPLVAYNRINEYTIQGTAEKELTAKIHDAIKRGETVSLYCINKPQAG